MNGNHKAVVAVLAAMALINLFFGNWVVFAILAAVSLYLGRREVKRLRSRDR